MLRSAAANLFNPEPGTAAESGGPTPFQAGASPLARG